MLYDTIVLATGSSIQGSATPSGIAFPVGPVDGQKFRLTAATATHEAGEYTWNTVEWTNVLVQLAKNGNFTATGKIGSGIGINSAVLTTATGAVFPTSPVDGQKFRLTAATATYEIGEYTYNTANAEWSNALVELAKNNTTFSATGKKGSNVVLNSASSAIPYDIGMQILGKPDASSVVGRFVAVRAFKLPVNLVNSLAKSATSATASTVLSVKKNGSQFATVTFAAGATNGTFVAATETAFAIGDIFTLTAAAVQDAGFSDAQITFVAALA